MYLVLSKSCEPQKNYFCFMISIAEILFSVFQIDLLKHVKAWPEANL